MISKSPFHLILHLLLLLATPLIAGDGGREGIAAENIDMCSGHRGTFTHTEIFEQRTTSEHNRIFEQRKPLEQEKSFEREKISEQRLLFEQCKKFRQREIPPLPDSISVLIFSGFKVDRIAVTAPGRSVVNGRQSRRREYVVRRDLSDGTAMLKVDGASFETWSVLPPPGKVLDLEFGGRRKRLRGALRINAAKERLTIIGRMALRDYLAATLGSEASSSEPMEFLVALSAVQRNYLATHRERHAPDADLCDVTHCQLADFTGVSSRIYQAVERSMEISLESGDALPCYYSVNCGGSTLTPAQIWRSAEPGYANVSCPHCRGSERYRWERTIAVSPAVEEVLRQAPVPPFVDDDFKIRLGRIAGFNKVLSNTIDRIERRGRNYMLAGRGFGHRVGLCMEGGRQLALQGRQAAEILRFYFPTARVRTQS